MRFQIFVATLFPAVALMMQQQIKAQSPIEYAPIARTVDASARRLELTVQVTDIKHADGQLLIAVFDQENGFPKEIQKAITIAKASPKQPQVTFKNLPAGNYAVVVVHDRNQNNQVDKNFMGIPNEPIGLSNYTTIGLSNRPDFGKASFSMQQSGLMKIKLISL